jgi:hypothetical protein
MSLVLFWMYLTLGRRVSKTRRAFEEQLVRQGMSKEDARKLSSCFENLKDSITSTLKQEMIGPVQANIANVSAMRKTIKSPPLSGNKEDS